MDVDPRWLHSGETPSRSPAAVVTADHAEWVDVPEYDLRDLTDEGKGRAVSTTPLRKDWLNKSLGFSTSVWLATLPEDFPQKDLREGDLALFRDVKDGEAQNGAIYLARRFGRLMLIQLDMLDDGAPAQANLLAERRMPFRHLGHDDDQAKLVARVLGVPFKRL